jgi:hypothetical protein
VLAGGGVAVVVLVGFLVVVMVVVGVVSVILLVFAGVVGVVVAEALAVVVALAAVAGLVRFPPASAGSPAPAATHKTDARNSARKTVLAKLEDDILIILVELVPERIRYSQETQQL